MKKERNRQLHFFVTEDELSLIQQKMKMLGTDNLSAYLRKMAIDGHIIKLEIPELKEMVSLLRRISNNINQITKRANATGRVYEDDLSEIQESQNKLWFSANEILKALSRIP